jgi:hypothetical protein
VNAVHVTLLIEDLSPLIRAVPGDRRFPSLETIFARGRVNDRFSETANHLRFRLFGFDPDGALPIAALTHVSDRKALPKRNEYFWLRSDPVTLWADMARVFMTNYGFADLDPFERNEIEHCIRGVLEEEGIHMHADHPERWCIALNAPLEFEFTPLDDAMGMNMAEALPDHPEARFWRRILNEIQVALHHCPVNVRRRQAGKQEVNSVWFWGGGFIPEAAPHDLFDTVYSNHPVSRGLAIINDCRLKKQQKTDKNEFLRNGRSVLIDWIPETTDAAAELASLDALSERLLGAVSDHRLELEVYDGKGAGRHYDRRASRRFWRRRSRLSFESAVSTEA